MEKAEAMLSLHAYQSRPHMLQLLPVRKHRRVGTRRESSGCQHRASTSANRWFLSAWAVAGGPPVELERRGGGAEGRAAQAREDEQGCAGLLSHAQA